MISSHDRKREDVDEFSPAETASNIERIEGMTMVCGDEIMLIIFKFRNTFGCYFGTEYDEL